MKSIFRHCLVVLALAYAQTTFAQVQIDRDLQMNGGAGDRDITGATTVDVTIGYSFGGTATAQQYLRGNGSYFVPSALLASDLSGTISNAQLSNASVAINTGTGLSGGGSLALGGSLSLTNTGVTSLSGTANQVNVSAATGAVTLSLPQNMHTGASPAFTGLNLSGLAASSAVYTDASKNLTTTAPASGALGYWTRTGTNLYPTTLTDNTGIGTSTPAVKLEVAHNGASTFGTGILINQNAVGNSDGPRLGFRKLLTAPSINKDWTIGIQNGVGADRFGISEDGGTGGFGTERFTILAGGNVGIGIAAPSAQLHTTGTVRFQNYPNGLYAGDASGNLQARTLTGTAGRITVANGNGAAGNPTFDLATTGTAGTYTKVTTDAYGRVTSGTTLAATDIPAGSGQYIQNQTGAAQSGAGFWTGGTGRIEGSLSVSQNNANGGGIILADDGDIVDLNDAYATHRFSYGLRITNANRGGTTAIQLANGAAGSGNTYFTGANVGIGSTVVNNRLQIQSDGSTQAMQWNTSSYISPNQWGSRIFKTDIGGGIPLRFETQYVGTWGTSIDIGHGQTFDHPSLRAYNAIMPSGGNASTAGIYWPVNIGGGGGDEAFIRHYVEGGENLKLMIGIGNDADDDIGFYQSGAERMTIYGGNVGIATTTPGATLDVGGSATSGIRTQYLNISTNNTSVSDRPFIRGTTTHLVINGGGTTSGGDLYLNYTGDGTTGAVRIRENLFAATNGNVGIGVVTPSYKLQAQGDIYANGGWFRVSGNQGYYFESHGGGWQMTDATWLRSYNNKGILATGGLAGYGNANFGLPYGGNPRIYGNYDNLGAGGIAIADDGGFYDFNDGWVEFRGSTGLSVRADNNAGGILVRMTNTGGGSQADRRVIPDINAWGLVGASGNAWYQMWSYNFVNASERALKKDITKVESGIGEAIMRDLDKMHPYLYRYNVEMDEMVEGLETRYRPNYHLGLILDETPDYIQAGSFDGIDVYAVASLGIAAAKHNREEIKQLKEVIGVSGATRTVQDFGSRTITGRELTVKFDAAFASSLNGAVPVVTISTNTPGADLVVKEKSAEGFKVVVNGAANNVSFDYIAMAKVQTGSLNNNEVAPEVANRMYVSEGVKNQVREYWKKQPEVMKQYHEQKAKEAVAIQQQRAAELKAAEPEVKP